jgi:16S rRNA (adenine1518-N6/adenine1519-N6)-dimethyltransferase
MAEKSMRSERSEGPRGRTKRQVLGRHYLASPGILARILGAIDPAPDDFIVEIGPGRGVLTFPLAERAGRVVAVEKDPDAVAFLRKNPLPNLDVLHGDILDVDLPSLISARRGAARTIKLVGNLPYSISSPLFFKVLDERSSFDRAAFLVQKEVAEKVCARPGGKEYGPIAIRLQSQFAARIEFAVKPGAFVPPPKVDSAFLTLVKRPEGMVPDEEEPGFGRFLRASFRERRRTLRNNLAACGYQAARIDDALAAAGFNRTVRPEEVPIEDFIALFGRLAQRPPLRGEP